uniref:Chaperone DnaJ C-terminal domain-containing protein n=1 Tax=Salix viminalis TaxID=40686 RepID=A0A6N2NCP5_SALVM
MHTGMFIYFSKFIQFPPSYAVLIVLFKINAARKTTISCRQYKKQNINIDVKQGGEGNKITFPDKGNEQQNQLPADLVFIIDEKPLHIQRDGNDLSSAKESNRESHHTRRPESINSGARYSEPGYELVVAMEGMPITKEQVTGRLRITFEVKFPQIDTRPASRAQACIRG